MSQQTLDLIHCSQNKLGYRTHLRRALRFITVAWEREKQKERGGGVGERIRGLEVLLASEKESERASKRKGEWKQADRKKERATMARRRALFRVRQRKNYGERESEGN